MKLTKILKEAYGSKMPTPTDPSVDVDKYIDELQRYILSFFKNNDLGGWTLSVDNHSGTFEWSLPDGKIVVMATPFWEAEPEIPISVIVDGGDSHDLQGIPFKPTYNKIIDFKFYKKAMSKVLPMIEHKFK